MRVTIVAANSGEFDSRLRRTARALADDGHAVTIVAWQRPGLAAEESLPGGVTVRRIPLDLRVTSAVSPLPEALRRAIARVLGFDPDATVLPPGAARGLDRVRAPLRRAVEVLAHLRRVRPWAAAVAAAAPADVYHAKALIALPVVRACARRTRGRFVYDIADIHVEAARLARMPAFVRRIVAGREARWMREAAGLTAVSEAVAREIARRYGVAEPIALLNTPPAWRPADPVEGLDDGRLRGAAGLPPERAIVLYQGGLSIDRGIEELVEALDEPSLASRDVAAVFLGYGRLRAWLGEAAARRPGRIAVIDAVPLDELLGYTAGAAVGYVGQPGRTLNQRLNLANKLFESWMAGVPVIVAGDTEHCRLVTAEAGGVCAEVSDPGSIAAAIIALLDGPPGDVLARREHCRELALTRYSWETARAGVVELYRRLAADLGPRAAA